MNSKNNKQTVLGILALCIPLVLGLAIWPDIKSTFSPNNIDDEQVKQARTEDVHICYQVDERRAKVRLDKQKEFEERYPNAKMLLTVDGEYYAIPLKDVDEFIKDFGAENVKLAVYDENKNLVPELSVHRVPGY